MSKILVVDDNPKMIEKQLMPAARGVGREVFPAANAPEALRLIREHEFDVVVTDLSLEGSEDTSGIDVLKAAKAKSIYTQVIIITAYGTPEISIETMRLGAFDYLERSAGTDIPQMLEHKITLALEFRNAKLGLR